MKVKDTLLHVPRWLSLSVKRCLGRGGGGGSRPRLQVRPVQRNNVPQEEERAETTCETSGDTQPDIRNCICPCLYTVSRRMSH